MLWRRKKSQTVKANPDSAALFPPDFLSRIESLTLTARRIFRGSMLAQRRTQQRGSGLEFAEHRDYTGGDDLRHVDWNVYARHGDLLLKRFQEEQDLQVALFVDCSPSMSTGLPSKFDLARQLAAGLACMALAELDRVTVVAWADGIVQTMPTARGISQAMQVLPFLSQLSPTGHGTSLSQSITQWLATGRCAPGIAVVISDCFDATGCEAGLDLLRQRGLEVHLLQVFHPEEAEPSCRGILELVDSETGAIHEVSVSQATLNSYRKKFQQHQTALFEYCRKYQIGCLQVSATEAFDAVLLRMMRSSQGTT